MSYSNKKYHGLTDEEGKIVFLLPKKQSYMVSLNYEKDIKLVDLTRSRGIGYMQTSIPYHPDPRLQFPERFLPSPNEVNTFDISSLLKKRYPDTQEDEIINIHAKWGSNTINSGSKEALLELGFSVKDVKNEKMVAKPINICFVLDRSGSMGGERMDILKEAMHNFIAKLRPIDKVSIVFFSSSPVIAYKHTNTNKNELTDIINAVQAGGGTNIFDGLKLGYKQIHDSYMDNSVNRVILLTDGYGSQPIDLVLDQSKKYFDKGITVSAIGVGMGCNNSLLEMVSKYSGGTTYQALAAKGISSALEAEFESLFYPLASNLKISVKYNNRIIYKTIYGFPESSNKNNMVEFKVGKVYRTLNKMALLKFKIENPAKDIDKNIITIIVDYYDEIKKEDVKIKKEVHLNWSDETDIEMIYDEQLKNTYSLAVINQCMKAIADLCDAENYEAAGKNIKETLKALRKTNDNKVSEELKPFFEQLEFYLDAINRVIKNKH